MISRKEILSVEKKDGNSIHGIVSLPNELMSTWWVVFVPWFERFGMESKWRIMSQKLNQYSVPSLQFDFSWLGLSDWDYGVCTIDSLSNELIEISIAFKNKYWIKDIVFVSHSMGCWVSLYANNNTDIIHIKKMVFISPALHQDILNRFRFTVWKMKSEKVEVCFDNYSRYFDENEYQHSITSQQIKKANIMAPEYLIQMSKMNFVPLLNSDIQIFCVLWTKDVVVPIESQPDGITSKALIITGGDHDLEKPGIMGQWVDKAVEFIIQ